VATEIVALAERNGSPPNQAWAETLHAGSRREEAERGGVRPRRAARFLTARAERLGRMHRLCLVQASPIKRRGPLGLLSSPPHRLLSAQQRQTSDLHEAWRTLLASEPALDAAAGCEA